MTYRIYVLNSQDRTADLIEAAFESDQAALTRAEAAMDGRYAAEIWRGECLVARLGGQLELAASGATGERSAASFPAGS